MPRNLSSCRDWNNSGKIVYVYQLKRHKLQFDPRHCQPVDTDKSMHLQAEIITDVVIEYHNLSDSAREAQLSPQSSGFLSMLVVNPLEQISYDKLVQIPIDAFRLLNSIDWDSVLISKFWSLWYHLQARLQLSTTRLRYFMTVCRKNLQR